jgi:hypothetical protein
MMTENFNDLPWHDANLVSVYIDRRNPGHRDEVEICVEWPSGTLQMLVFRECYAFSASMNFGIIASESILDASEYQSHEKLTTLRKKLNYLENYFENLKYYVIETNSTGGVLEIFCNKLIILNIDKP